MSKSLLLFVKICAQVNECLLLCACGRVCVCVCKRSSGPLFTSFALSREMLPFLHILFLFLSLLPSFTRTHKSLVHICSSDWSPSPSVCVI